MTPLRSLRAPPPLRPRAVFRPEKSFPLEFGCKPGSVPAFVTLRGWRSFIWAARCRTAQATNSGSGIDAGHAGGLPRDPFSVLLQVGFAVPLLSPGGRCALTTPFHPYPITRLPARLAVYFLLHCPSSHLDWPLASTLPKEPGLSSATQTRRRDHLSSSSGKQAQYSVCMAGTARVLTTKMPASRPSSGFPSRRCGGSRGRSRSRCRAGEY